MNTFDNEKLSPQEKRVIVDKGTESPFTGEYNNHFETGMYHCRRCNSPLYISDDKFDAGCGWPAFDDEIPGAVSRQTDADGRRTEILCARCGAHLGHVFSGENLTEKNTRHCVNSLSLRFITSKQEIATFALGCFWGAEEYFRKAEGVVKTRVGYTGGDVENPSYEQVCDGNTGHFEALEVTFETSIASYEEMVKLFFQIHDFAQTNGQGPDIGAQYRSAIFYRSEEQKGKAREIIKVLEDRGYEVATQLLPAQTFWEAEDYHQKYYMRNNQEPYCHIFKPLFASESRGDETKEGY